MKAAVTSAVANRVDSVLPGSGPMVKRLANRGIDAMQKTIMRMQKHIRTIAGSGDYVIPDADSPSQNVLHPLLSNPNKPLEFANTNGSTLFARTEFVCNLTSIGNGGFGLKQFKINIGNARLFKWGSRLASGYRYYRLKGCVFEVRTMSSTVGVTGAVGMGTVMSVATNDARESTFMGGAQLLEESGSVSSVPYQSHLCFMECANPQVAKFHVSGEYETHNVSANPVIRGDNDPDVTDQGTYVVAQDGIVGSAGIFAQLFVHYVVELIEPTLRNHPTLGSFMYCSFNSTGGTDYTVNPPYLANDGSPGAPEITTDPMVIGNSRWVRNIGAYLDYTSGAMRLTIPRADTAAGKYYLVRIALKYGQGAVNPTGNSFASQAATIAESGCVFVDWPGSGFPSEGTFSPVGVFEFEMLDSKYNSWVKSFIIMVNGSSDVRVKFFDTSFDQVANRAESFNCSLTEINGDMCARYGNSFTPGTF